MTSAPSQRAAVADRGSARAPDGRDQIGAWLDRLLRLTRLPARESAELRDELEAHLRERVRDLMLAGHDEPVAIHKSISELGDLALLASRYREASRTPKRRLIMHMAVIGAATAALGLSTFAIQRGQPEDPGPAGAVQVAPGQVGAGLYRLGLVPKDVGPDGEGTWQLGVKPDAALMEGVYSLGLVPERVDELGNGTWTLRLAPGATGPEPVLGELGPLRQYFAPAAAPSRAVVEDVDGEPLSGVLAMLAESQDLRPYIHWRDLQVLPDNELTGLPLSGQQLGRAMDMINDALELDGQARLEYRAADGLFEVASRDYFDRRERELVTYDVGDLVYADGPLEVTTESEVLVELIIEIVEPEAWHQNGGEAASISAVGGKLFVHAPPRVHERVAWLLSQLGDEERHSEADRERALVDFIAANLLPADPAVDAAVAVEDVLIAAAARPAAADPAAERALRDAVDAALPDTEILSLSHAAAAEIAPVIDRALRPLGGSAEPYARPNAVLVRGDARAREVARALVGALDRALGDRDEGAGPASLRLHAVGGRVIAEVSQGGETSRIEADRLEISGGRLTSLRALDGVGLEVSGDMLSAGYIVRPGDSWRSIAGSVLGDADQWERLADANPGIDPDRLAVGQVVHVPPSLGAPGR